MLAHDIEHRWQAEIGMLRDETHIMCLATWDLGSHELSRITYVCSAKTNYPSREHRGGLEIDE